MGKYQNVSTPRFYVDYFQYLSVVDKLVVSNTTNADDEKIKKLFYLNPSSTKSFGDSELGEVTGIAKFLQIYVETRHTSLEDIHCDYLAVLNHNIADSPSVADDGELDMTINYLLPSTGSVRNKISQDGVNVGCTYNGFSLFDIKSNPITEPGNGYESAMFGFRKSPGNDLSINLGAISAGKYYDMPHSPDLDLTMTREFGGAKKQFTRGGALLTNYNYTQPPTWGTTEPWGIYPPIETEDMIPRKEFRRAGRRTWDLKFSYLSSSDIMADMEMLNLHPIDEDVDHDYQPSLTDNTFFSQFMQKTLGGSLRFIFQPNNTDFNPDGFAICILDQDSISIKQVAHNTYNISLRIMEVW